MIKTNDRWEFYNWLCQYPLSNALVVLEKFETKQADTVTNELMDVTIRCSIGKDSQSNLVYYGQEIFKF